MKTPPDQLRFYLQAYLAFQLGWYTLAARAVEAVRRWDARVEAEHGPDAVWVAVSHGDVIKAVLADALGLHLDAFQRIVVDPGSLSVVRYTPLRPFVLTSNSTAGDLGHLRPPKQRSGRRRHRVSSDAAVGGGGEAGEEDLFGDIHRLFGGDAGQQVSLLGRADHQHLPTEIGA